MVQLNDRLLHLLDRHAARRGISRSALIRTALEDYLRRDQEAMVGEQIVEGYNDFRRPDPTNGVISSG